MADIRPRMVGARVQRVEDPRLLTGRGDYVDDRPGDLHVAFRRSEHAHARIGSVDASAALAMPGVVAAFDAEALAGVVAPLRATSRMRDYHATELPVLARGKVRYVGEPIVAVVARDRYAAEDGAELVEVECDPLPPVVDAMIVALSLYNLVIVAEAGPYLLGVILLVGEAGFYFARLLVQGFRTEPGA